MDSHWLDYHLCNEVYIRHCHITDCLTIYHTKTFYNKPTRTITYSNKLTVLLELMDYLINKTIVFHKKNNQQYV